MTVSRAVTDQKRAQEISERLAAIVLSSDDAIIGKTLDGIVTDWNPAAERMYGYSAAEMLGHPIAILVPPDRQDELPKILHRLRCGEAIGRFETVRRRKDGGLLDVALTISPIRDAAGAVIGASTIGRDITLQKQAESQIRASLREKEVLLKEIHHRVKNNLQIISSLLNLQAGGLKDESVRALFRESQNRIQSMALVHEKLYESKDLSSLSIRSYLEGLVAHVCRSFSVPTRIKIRVDVEDLTFPIDAAVPSALCVNELVSNAIEHAFTGDRAGMITVRLSRHGSNAIHLEVVDDGVGLPAGFELGRVESLGLRLVVALSEQLGGGLEVGAGPGGSFRMTFPFPQPRGPLADAA